jgi:DNA-binding XRE family transcriptional regulator
MSPEQLGWAVGVSGHTIRRIERQHSVPTPRVQYALAQFFGLRPTEIWHVDSRRVAA